MGLDIGIISVTYLERPHGNAYEFAWELASEASAYGYMAGEGNNWSAFTQRQVLQMLDEFAERKNLAATEKAQVLDWVRSLPWDRWRQDLPPGPIDYDDDFNPVVDAESEIDGGVIELHFNW